MATSCLWPSPEPGKDRLEVRQEGAPPSCCWLTRSQPAASPGVPQVHARWGRGRGETPLLGPRSARP